ncbi:Glucosamine--fructose-6-phosphate aminotransferase [isomerizing] [Olavius algarvensis spirochete endosymbiont]|uniref:glutamine--fructose-6-phosphate transaminase (isomerizing) n=1 Tax=Olavius algarvensis spirochete endosymbiont TaxID=260710 RepID=UPI000F105AA2|nr:glutamine--fructose-6-phosphate transaminase (isomerizing) [Olavius algarvensis spirochete endosymbiont]CAD7843318.1 MAG: Glutamine--fructose-6-phosphate aminotransferase [isomerizing] (EC 2.6.1.16) [Olavius algarvensis spirochete endosymbiont]VDA99435.1 Glucosamine--fructose-6-phosphate aminotransferase [isomerizing] [Olavius algarvensis spirochete endosymbiont]
MCGIIGYCGSRNAAQLLLSGLKQLEYRGYDSAGIAVVHKSNLQLYKKAGKIEILRAIVPDILEGHWGIGHTRWASHGKVNDINAHPHTDCTGKIAICHNGIIENYTSLKKRLDSENHRFISQTDSEVIAHLTESFYEGNLVTAVKSTASLLEGTYGILAIHVDHPNQIVGVRNGSPMIIGLADKEMLIASDVSAVRAHTKQVIYLEDSEIVSMNSNAYEVSNMRNQPINKKIEVISWKLQEVEKGSYPHYMLKEIHEQTESIPRALSGRIDEQQATAVLGGLNMSDTELLSVKRITITAAGTSFYAARVIAYLLETLARIPTTTELSSELRYRNPVVEQGTLYIAVSQSGETIDTLMAVRELQRKGAPVLAISNVVGASIAREAHGGIYIHSGPEIAVASTKAFANQLAAMYLFTLKMARMRHMTWPEGKKFLKHLLNISNQIEEILNNADKIEQLARKYCKAKNFLFLGRGINFPVALEGALKLKEVAYIHAEGYSSAEIKHGPIALINPQTPSIFLVPDDYLYNKILSSMKEVKARNGSIIAISTEGDTQISHIADDIFQIPKTEQNFYPFLTVVPLQLFAYYCALELKCDVDRPRNLAKSVTVE